MAVVVAIVAAFENWQVEVVEVAHCYQYCNWVPWIAMKFEEVEFETAVVVETVETNKDLLFVVTKVAKRQIFKRLKKWTYFSKGRCRYIPNTSSLVQSILFSHKADEKK